jgi:hypothetical protein
MSTPDIRTAQERLVSAYALCQGQYEEMWPLLLEEPMAACRAALAAEPGEVPAAWLYKVDPDFDGTTWRESWRVTTDEQVARFKAWPSCPVPLFRRAAASLQQLSAPTPAAPEAGEVAS